MPAYVNLMVVFDPLVTSHDMVAADVRARLGRGVATRGGRVHVVPVVYDGVDLAAVAARVGLSPEAVVAAHLAGDYAVYLYGFAPGYAYLAACPRRSACRARTPVCAVWRGVRHHRGGAVHRDDFDDADRLVGHRTFGRPDPAARGNVVRRGGPGAVRAGMSAVLRVVWVSVRR